MYTFASLCNASRSTPLVLPLSQGHPSQFDQVPHAGSHNDGLLVRVAGLIVALHLLNHELGVAQQGVLCELVEVQASRGHRGLKPKRKTRLSMQLLQFTLNVRTTILRV